MKIGFFCQEYPPRPHGGIGTFVKTLAEELARLGHEVTVVELDDKPGERRENLVRVVTLPQSYVRKAAWFINRWRLRCWLSRTLRSGEIEMFELPEFQGWLPFPGQSCRVVVRLHHADSILRRDGGEPDYPVLRLCEYLTLRNHTAWIGVSRYILNRTRAFFHLEPRHASVIYNPVTIAELPPCADLCRPLSWPYVLYVGSISERKGALTLARAARKVLAAQQDLRLVFIGGETEYRGLPISSEIRELVGPDLVSRVVLLGLVAHQEALHWIRHATVVALPSHLESFGLVPVEAMALGVPIIYTTSTSGPEVVRNGIDGLLVDPGDDEMLARYLLRLARDSDYAGKIAQAGRETACERFNVSNCVTNTLDFYRELVHAHG